MGGNTTVIDIVAQVTDRTEQGASGVIRTISKIEKAAKKMYAEITGLKKMSKIEVTMYAIDKASKVLGGISDAGRRIAGSVWKVTLKAVDLVTAPFRGIMRMVTKPIVMMAGIAGIGLGVGDIVGTYKDFEQGMANVKAIIRGTDAEMLSLTDTAKKLGAETMFSASKVAEGMEFLAMAGWRANDITAGMPGLLDLAAAGGVGVDTAADVVSSSLAQYSMAASESNRVADVLAATATNSKTDVTGLGESLKYVGPQAGALGYTIEDTALALGLMGNKGIDASSAGTALRTTLARMAKQGELTGEETAVVAEEMNKLGVSLTDAKANALPLITLLQDLRKGFKDLSETEKAATAANLAGVYAQSGLLAIVNASEEEFNTLAGAIASSTEAAREMASTRMDTLAGAFEELGGAAETIKIQFMERLAPHIKGFFQWLTDKMPGLQSAAINFADSVATAIGGITGAIDDTINTHEWKNAGTIWGKGKVAWDKLIAAPFGEWWNGEGMAWAAGISEGLGLELGSGITAGISAILGIDMGEAADDGINIGKAFAAGLKEGLSGIDWGDITKGVCGALSAAFKIAFSNPLTGVIAGSWLGGKAFGITKSIQELFSAGGAFSGIAHGLSIAKATKSGDVFALANAGQLGLGAKIGSAGIGGMALGAGGIMGGAVGGMAVFSSISDSFKAIKASDKREADVYEESATWKGVGVILGAAIGSVLPGAGTLVGAGIGAGIGGAAGMFMGNSAKRRYEEALEQEKKAEAAEILEREQKKYESQDLKDALADANITGEQFASLFREKVTENLNSHFGNITLTLDEIQSIAENLTFANGSKSLNTFGEAAKRAGDSFAKLQSAASFLEKLNWKASLGFTLNETDFTLNETDISTYKEAAESFINDAQSYIEDTHYETVAAVNLLIGVDTSSDIIGGINNYYADIQSQLSDLSSEFTAKISIALEDGIFELDEQAEITRLQEQITAITEKISLAQSEAKLETLKIKYTGAALDANSFTEIQSELQRQVAFTTQNYDDALQVTITNLQLQLQDGALSQEDYNAQLKLLTEGYKAEIDNLEVRVTEFQLDMIADAYASELDCIMPDIEGTTSEKLSAAFNRGIESGIDPVTWDAGTVAELIGIDSLGLEAQEAIIGRLSAVAATIPDSILSSIGDGMAEADFAGAGELAGIETVNGVSKALADNADSVRPGCEAVRNSADEFMAHFFEKAFNVESTVNITADYRLTNPNYTISGDGVNSSKKLTISSKNADGGIFGAHADGGIFGAHADGGIIGGGVLRPIADYTDSRGVMSKPHVGLVGEDGAEAIIPLTAKRRKRGISLWEKAGEILGVGRSAYAEGGIIGMMGVKSQLSALHEDRGVKSQLSALHEGREVKPQLPAPAIYSDAPNDTAAVVPVTIGDVTFDVKIEAGAAADPDTIVAILKANINNLTDEIARSIAVSVEQVWANMTFA